MNEAVAETVNVICMKWGTLYGPEYVNRLYSMVQRNLTRPFRFACFTDDASGIDDGVETFDLPPIGVDPDKSHLPWRKIGLFNEELGDLTGPTLFLDLDLVIVDNIDCLFDYPGHFVIIHNWTHPNDIVGNSSVYRFTVGADSYVLDRFHSESHQHWIDTYRNSQTFLSHSVKDLTYWPAEWCVSFKRHCLPGGIKWYGMAANMMIPSKVPKDTKIVVFHGHPNPDDALAGRWPGGFYKGLKPATWIRDHWN